MSDSTVKDPAAPLRIVYFGTYRAGYSRNRIMIDSLRQSGIDVIECQETLWRGIEDRVQVASGGWLNPGFAWRALRAYARLIARFFLLGDFDVMVVGYPGQFDVYLARLLAWLRRRPLVWDVFMSIYLIAIERGLERKSSFTTRMLYHIEKLALRLPDMLVHDTDEYVAWLCKTYGLDPGRFRLVPTGADDRVFYPRQASGASPGIFRAVYYGTFIPNHGVDVMIEAARLLSDEAEIAFTFIGTGPEQEKARQAAAGLRNVEFVDWMDKDVLAGSVASANLCLGVFGHTPQSLMTVQNKIYECLAMRKPVVSGTSPVMRRAFTHQKHLYLCERDANSLAQAVRFLYRQPGLCAEMAEEGYRLFCEQYNMTNLGARYSRHVREAYSRFSGGRRRRSHKENRAP